MTHAKPSLLLRSDTILGVCQGLGEEFGFNPNWLRVAIAASFYWVPLQISAVYLALGGALALARYLYPVPAAASAEAAAVAPAPVVHAAEPALLAA